MKNPNCYQSKLESGKQPTRRDFFRAGIATGATLAIPSFFQEVFRLNRAMADGAPNTLPTIEFYAQGGPRCSAWLVPTSLTGTPVMEDLLGNGILSSSATDTIGGMPYYRIGDPSVAIPGTNNLMTSAGGNAIWDAVKAVASPASLARVQIVPFPFATSDDGGENNEQACFLNLCGLSGTIAALSGTVQSQGGLPPMLLASSPVSALFASSVQSFKDAATASARLRSLLTQAPNPDSVMASIFTRIQRLSESQAQRLASLPNGAQFQALVHDTYAKNTSFAGGNLAQQLDARNDTDAQQIFNIATGTADDDPSAILATACRMMSQGYLGGHAGIPRGSGIYDYHGGGIPNAASADAGIGYEIGATIEYMVRKQKDAIFVLGANGAVGCDTNGPAGDDGRRCVYFLGHIKGASGALPTRTKAQVGGHGSDGTTDPSGIPDPVTGFKALAANILNLSGNRAAAASVTGFTPADLDKYLAFA